MLEDRRHDARLRRARESRRASQHLAEHGAKREHVGSRVRVSAFELLRRHVLHGAQDQPGRRNRFEFSDRVFCEPEVEEFRIALHQHHVGRLQIAMHDACAVRGVERGRHLYGVVQCLGNQQRTALQPRRQRLAFEMLHHQIVHALLVTDVEERADVGMRERSDRLRLTDEPRLRIRVGVAENLDRDYAIEPRVARLPDLAHAASADGGQDFIRPETGADGQWQKRRYGLDFQFKITRVAKLVPDTRQFSHHYQGVCSSQIPAANAAN